MVAFLDNLDHGDIDGAHYLRAILQLVEAVIEEDCD